MGERAISAMGHVRMMAAVQPALSGAISKTVNLPESATVEDIEKIYLEGWKLGLKALAIYRDNCKVGQPLSVAKTKTAQAPEPAAAEAAVPHEVRPVRRRLPRQRSATVTRFSVAGAEGYMTASEYPDDGVGEVFLKLGKQGSTLAGVMDAFSVAISVGLQYGIPLESYVAKFTNMRFEPAGITDDADIRMASSVMDYIFRRLALDHLSYDERSELGILTTAERTAALAGEDPGRRGRGDRPGGARPVGAGRERPPAAGQGAGGRRGSRRGRAAAPAAQLHGADRVAAGPDGRRAAVPDLRHEDAARRAAATSARAAARPAAAAELSGCVKCNSRLERGCGVSLRSPNQYPWQWVRAEAEAFITHSPVAVSTARQLPEHAAAVLRLRRRCPIRVAGEVPGSVRRGAAADPA